MRTLIRKVDTKFFFWKTLRKHPELRHAYSIPSHLTIQEKFQLFKLAQGNEVIVEIGSYMGASATCFGVAKMMENGGKILCIDTWNNDAMTEGKKDTFNSFKTNISPYQKWITPIRGLSTKVVDQIKEKTKGINLLFIDGDHSYEGVKGDWEAYRNFLNKGSIVVFHDIGWAEGVRRVIKEDVLPLVSNSNSLPNMWWGEIHNKI